jgi:hypothetical protein
MMMDRAALIAHIEAGVIVLRATLISVMRMDMIESAGCSQVVCDIALSLDVVPKIRYQQRHDRGKLGKQKEAHQAGSKPPQFAH